MTKSKVKALPLEIWGSIHKVLDLKTKKNLELTSRGFHRWKNGKRNKFFCLWRNCWNGHCTTKKYFIKVQDCLRYVDTVKYDSYGGEDEAHYLEIGEIKNNKEKVLCCFDLRWDDECSRDDFNDVSSDSDDVSSIEYLAILGNNR